MDWARGFRAGGVILGISLAGAAYVFGCIWALGYWAIIPALAPIFLAIVYVEAQ